MIMIFVIIIIIIIILVIIITRPKPPYGWQDLAGVLRYSSSITYHYSSSRYKVASNSCFCDS